jgi:hypothetical protein
MPWSTAACGAHQGERRLGRRRPVRPVQGPAPATPIWGQVLRGDKLFGGEDWPTALVVKAGEFRPTPSRDGHRWRARRDTEFYHIGMPIGVSLFVWLPAERAKWLEMDA